MPWSPNHLNQLSFWNNCKSFSAFFRKKLNKRAGLWLCWAQFNFSTDTVFGGQKWRKRVGVKRQLNQLRSDHEGKRGCVYVLQITMQFLNCSLNHRWAFSNVWGHLRKNKKENNYNRMRMGKEHQKLKQSFICKTFWNVHLPTSGLQILASPLMNKHSWLQSCWPWKASAHAKQGQYT